MLMDRRYRGAMLALVLVMMTGCQSTSAFRPRWPFVGISQASATTTAMTDSAPPSSSSVAADPNAGVIPASAEGPIAENRAANPPAGESEEDDLVPDDRWRTEDKGEGGLLGENAAEQISRGVMSMAGYGESRAAAKEKMAQAEEYIRQARANPDQASPLYDKAIKSLGWAAYRWPDSVIQEDAMFLQAECYFFTDRYPKALELYSGLLKKYDNTRYMNTVTKRLFAIGQFWAKRYNETRRGTLTPNMTNKTEPTFSLFEQSIKAFDLIRIYDARGPLADDAMMATAVAYFQCGEYDDATYYFDQMRVDYADSEHAKAAHLLGLESKLRMYQGPKYDGTPIEDADKLADRTVFQVNDSPEDKEHLRETIGRIKLEKAKRDWMMAEYYDQRQQYGAARLYYQNIIKDYSGTPHAERATKRLQEIMGRPDEPPDRFKWLTKIFPDHEED